MFERFAKSVSKVTAVISGKEIFSEQGKEKLRALSTHIEHQIQVLDGNQLESSPSSSSEDKGKAPIIITNLEQKKALDILRKVKALLDKLITLNSWQFMALASLESAAIDPDKAIHSLSLEELVQDLLMNRDIYWDIKNKLLHQNLTQLFTALKELKLDDFSDAGTGILYTIGGVEKIHAVGIILSSLLPFYDITESRAGVSEGQYHPHVDARLLPTFRQELYALHDAFLAEIRNSKTTEEKSEILDRYKKMYHEKVETFLQVVHGLPGETIFLEANNSAFNQDSVISFRPQGGILRGLLPIESSLNAELAQECKELLTEPLLTSVYDDVANSLDQSAIYQPRKELFTMVEAVILQPFQSYINENAQETGLTKAKADLLQYFLTDFIYGKESIFRKTPKGLELFVNKDGQWRTADNFTRGQLYTCAEIATKLLAELIAVLKEHDQLCKQANRGVGRTGLLLADAIEATAQYLKIPYDRRVDDAFLSALTSYKEQMSANFGPQANSQAQSSGMSLKR